MQVGIECSQWVFFQWKWVTPMLSNLQRMFCVGRFLPLFFHNTSYAKSCTVASAKISINISTINTNVSDCVWNWKGLCSMTWCLSWWWSCKCIFSEDYWVESKSLRFDPALHKISLDSYTFRESSTAIHSVAPVRKPSVCLPMSFSQLYLSFHVMSFFFYLFFIYSPSTQTDSYYLQELLCRGLLESSDCTVCQTEWRQNR